MKKLMITLTALSFLFAAVPALAEEAYPGPWQDERVVELDAILEQNNINDCLHYQYKQSKDNSNQYKVQCDNGHVYYVDLKTKIADSDLEEGRGDK